MKFTTQPTLLTKSQKEFQGIVFNILSKLVLMKGYIKGYGKLDRLMDETHNPIENIDRKITDCLRYNALITNEGLIFRATLKASTITKQDQINLELIK